MHAKMPILPRRECKGGALVLSIRSGLGALALLALTGCNLAADSPVRTPGFLPAAQWDHLPEGSAWTEATLRALESEGVPLVNTVPSDIEGLCPGYAAAPPAERRAFWVGFLSYAAKVESRWNPLAKGGGGRFKGLMQISDATARANGCAAGEALLDGSQNLSCAVRILARQVGEDGAVVGGGARGWLGAARDWLPFRKKSTRSELARWTSAQSYCR